MTDVLIVNPPSPDGHVYIRDMCRWGRKSREKMVWPQSSLAYLAAMVPDSMSVRIIDAIAEEMSIEAFLEEIREEKPKFYVSYVTGTTFAVDARGIQEAKLGGATTIGIGTHVSAVPGNTLELIPELDFVIRHEPEQTFREIIDRVTEGRPMADCIGIALRGEDGQAVITPDRPLLKSLDDLPIPLQHLLPLDRYKMPFLGSRYVWVLTNRGCPYSCTYCFEGVVWGKSVRFRSAESIYRELVYLAEHDVHNVLFLADLFTYNKKGVLELCDLIIERGLKVRWTCNSRVDTLDEEMVVKMKQAGCWLIAFGIESGSQKVLDNVKKDAQVEDAVRTINLCHRHGVKTWGYFIIGLPGETKETVRETIDLAKKIPLDIALFHVAMPYAGTEFYFQAVANGWLNTYDWKHFDMNDSAVLGYGDFNSDEILKATKQAFREFYLRPVQAWRLLSMMRASGDFSMVYSVARNFLSWIFSGKEDRVASRSLDDGPKLTGSVNPEDARKALHSLPVMEAPRVNPNTAKPRHVSVKEASKGQAVAPSLPVVEASQSI
ncbi:B12-binding domain-containing radical SAM protein [Tundrisphaera lichenicola]|uniref:B12-binding domain-containing radical SAM protein n=1 Tax=Tundrisphaera lichenicola TaxID=2029860 RepID=UPI003EBB6756